MTLNSLKNDICSQYRRSNLSKTLHLYLYVLSDGTNSMSRLTQLFYEELLNTRATLPYLKNP